MALYYAIGIQVQTQGSNAVSDVPNWYTIKPTYVTYTGSSKAFDLSSGLSPISTLLTDYNGDKYVVYPWDTDRMGGDIVNYLTSCWAHNDTSSYSHPADFTVNVDHLKDVYICAMDDAPDSINYNGTTIPVFRFKKYWDMWKERYGAMGLSYHNQSGHTIGLDFDYSLYNKIIDVKQRDIAVKSGEDSTFPGSYGVTIIQMRYGQYDLPYHTPYHIGLSGGTGNITSSYAGISGAKNIYSFDIKKSTNNDSNKTYLTVPTYINRIFAIHNGGKSNPIYQVGFWGAASGTGTTITTPAYGGYRLFNSGYNNWLSMAVDSPVVNTCYAITVDTTSQFILKEIPVQLGKKYTFNIWGDGRQNYDGVVLGKTTLSAGSYSSTLATLFGSSNTNVIGYGSFQKGMTNSTVINYTPTEDGTVYMYLRKGTNTSTSYQTYSNTTLGDVGLFIADAPAVTVTLNKNSGTGGTDSVSIAPGTAAANYPAITLPTRSGYIFQGYYDDQTGGTVYYNAAGQGTKVFDKVAAVTLYAHWQQEAVETVIVNLNQNGGTGGQSQVAIPKNATTSQYPSIQIPTRVGLSSSSPAFGFIGYWDGINQTTATQYIGETGQGVRTFNKTSTCTFYAGWRNNIYVDFLDSVTVTFSPNSQSVKIANSTICSSDDTPTPVDGGLVGQNAIPCTFTDGGKYVTIPASAPVGTYMISYHLSSPANVTAAEGYHSYNKLCQGCQLTIIKATPTFELQGQTVSQGNTAQAKVRASVPGTVYWGTSSSSMTTQFTITSNQAGSLLNLYNATNSTAGSTVTIYAYFVPTNTTSYNNSSTKSASLTVTTVQTVTITLNDNGGSGGSGSITVEKNSSFPVVNVPTRTGFDFLGYFTVSTATGGYQWVTNSGAPYFYASTSSTITIYARWAPTITYTPTFGQGEEWEVVYCSDQPEACTSTPRAVSFQIADEPISCIIQQWTVIDYYSTHDADGWTISHDGLTATIPAGVSQDYTYVRVKITVQAGTYGGYPYAANEYVAPHCKLRLMQVTLESTKYKDTNGTLGYNVTSSGTPTTPSINLYPYASNDTVSSSVQNNITWYQRYSNGTYNPTLYTQSNATGVTKWRIQEQSVYWETIGFYPDPNATGSQLLVGGQYLTVYATGYSGDRIYHGSMENYAVTNTATVRVYNADDPTKYVDKVVTVTNTLSSTHYSDTNGTQGNVSISYGAPYISVVPDRTTRVEAFTPGGTTYGSVYTSSVNSGTWYQKYSSGVYSLFSGTMYASAKWRIASQSCAGGTNRFSNYAGTSSSITVGGSSYVVYLNGEVKHSTMGTNGGDDIVTITAYNIDDLSKTATSSVTVTNGYTDTSTAISSYGTPVVSIGNGFTASNGSAVVTCTVTNSVRFRRDFDSGSSSTFTSALSGVAVWTIATNGSNRFTPSGTSTTFSGLTVYQNGDTIAHSTMGTWAGTDTVVVRAYNASSTKTTPSASKSASVTNSYTSGNPSIVTYGTPTVTIGTGITAAGGSATITCSVSNTQRVVRTYTTGDTSNVDTTVSGTAKWRITTNGSSRFTASGTSSALGSITVYNTGGKVTHTTMASYVGTDTVKVTAYNVDSSSKTKVATLSIANAFDSIAITVASNPINFGASTTMVVEASYTSGYKNDITSSASLSTNPSNIITITL